MTFLYPQFLWFLFAISIPIIIHLFNFRIYKTVYFSNVQFLKNIEQQTKSKSKLKEILILIARILAVVALVIAFAQPVILKNQEQVAKNKNIIGIYIDNSFSMNAESKFGKIIEVAKNRANSIVKAHQPTTKYLFLTNNFESKHQHLYNREIIEDFVSETNTSPNLKKISSVFSKMDDYIQTEEESNNIFYFISDFQKITTDFQNLPKNSNSQIFLMPLSTNQSNNLYVDSLYFETPYRSFGREEKLFVEIKNISDESYQDMPIKLFINDTLKSLGSYNIEAKSSQTVELVYSNTEKGFINGKVEITDYPVVYDNEFYFSYSIAEKTKILIINNKDNNIYLNSFFKDDESFEIQNVMEDNIPISEFNKHHLIIFAEVENYSSGLISELESYVNNGGAVIFTPNIRGKIETYNKVLTQLNLSPIVRLDTTNTKIGSINEQHLLYFNTFKKLKINTELPLISEYFVFKNNLLNKEEILLEAENGQKILSTAKLGKGNIYIFAMPLNKKSGNFVTHPLFSPTIYNIAIYSQLTDKIYYTVNKDEVIEIENFVSNSEFLKIEKIDGTYDFIPQTIKNGKSLKINLTENKIEAGNYFVKNNNEIVKNLSFNYNRKESDLECYTFEEIKKELEKYSIENVSIINAETELLEKKIKENSEGKKLWKIFIVLALLFIAIEIALIKIWLPT